MHSLFILSKIIQITNDNLSNDKKSAVKWWLRYKKLILPNILHITVFGYNQMFLLNTYERANCKWMINTYSKILIFFTSQRFHSLRTPSNVLLINLAVSDFMMATTGFPIYAVSSFYGHWPFSKQGMYENYYGITCKLFWMYRFVFRLNELWSRQIQVRFGRYKSR